MFVGYKNVNEELDFFQKKWSPYSWIGYYSM